jgi:hypothetical protein
MKWQLGLGVLALVTLVTLVLAPNSPVEAGGIPCTSTIIKTDATFAEIRVCSDSYGNLHVQGAVATSLASQTFCDPSGTCGNFAGQVFICGNQIDQGVDNVCKSLNPITNRSGFTKGFSCIDFTMSNQTWFAPQRIDLQSVVGAKTEGTNYLSTFYNKRVGRTIALLDFFNIC